MKRLYFVAPFLVAVTFGGYYAYWSTGASARSRAERDDAIRRRNAAILHDEYEGRDGKREAEADLKAGKIVMLNYGLPVEWYVEYGELLRQRYGIEDRWIAGCIVTKSLTTYVEAYDSVMTQKIVGKFGTDIFSNLEKDARKSYEEKHLGAGANQSKDPAP